MKINEQDFPQSMKSDDFISRLKQELGFDTMADTEVGEFLLRGNKMPNTYKKEGLYIGVGNYKEDGMEGLWPITIAFRFGKGDSEWKTLAQEMQRELLNKKDGDKIFDIESIDRSSRNKDELILRFNDAIIPSTTFFDFLKKYVGKFENLVENNSMTESKTKKVVKLSESDLTNIVKQVIEEQEKQEAVGIAKNLFSKLIPKLPSKLKDAFNKAKQSGNIEPLMALVPANKKEQVFKKGLELSKNPTKLENEINKLPVSEQLGWIIVFAIPLLLAIIFLSNPDRVYYGTNFGRLGQIDFDFL